MTPHNRANTQPPDRKGRAAYVIWGEAGDLAAGLDSSLLRHPVCPACVILTPCRAFACACQRREGSPPAGAHANRHRRRSPAPFPPTGRFFARPIRIGPALNDSVGWVDLCLLAVCVASTYLSMKQFSFSVILNPQGVRLRLPEAERVVLLDLIQAF